MRQGVFKRIYELLLEDEVITLDQVFLLATPASLPSIPPGDLSLTALRSLSTCQAFSIYMRQQRSRLRVYQGVDAMQVVVPDELPSTEMMQLVRSVQCAQLLIFLAHLTKG